MLPYFQEYWGNPSSLHSHGTVAAMAIDVARRHVASALAAKPDDIFFTGSGTESDNWAIQGVVAAHWKQSKSIPHIVTSSVEHEAVLAACIDLEDAGLAKLTYLPVDSKGRVSPRDLERALERETLLVSIMHANNETGVLQPLELLIPIAKARGALVHTDAVQTFGKLPLDVDKLGVDLLTLSAHKIYGPKGVGVLFRRSGTDIVPLIRGGGQEQGLRAGTYDVTGIVGLGEAARLAVRDMVRDGTRIAVLAERLQLALMDAIPDITFIGHPEERLPGTLNIAIPEVRGRALVMAMNLEGISISQGAACSAQENRISHVVAAMKLPNEQAVGACRLSLGRSTSDADIEYVLDRFPTIVSAARTYTAAIYREAQDASPPDCYARVI